MSPESLVNQYRVFGASRWIGVGLFGVGCVLAPAIVVTVFAHGGPYKWLVVAVGTLALPLGAFGTANDTAVAALRELDLLGAVPDVGRAELDHERAVRPARLVAVHASPKAALVFPLLAAAVQLWMGGNVWSAWNG